MSTLQSPRRKLKDTGRSQEAAHQDLSKLFGKEPPCAIENECALLGAMILDTRVIGEVVQLIQSPSDFYLPKHGTVYQVLVDMYDRNERIEMPQLKQKLADMSQLEEVGGVAYLLMLAESVPSAVSAPHYAKIVREKALLRQLIDAAGWILSTAYHTAQPVEDLLDEAEQAIFQLAESRVGVEATELKTLLQETYERLQAHEGRTITGLDTGFVDLNEMTSGIQNGDMIIIAARPSMGKTALALNIAEHVAANTGQPVAFFSLEMSKQQLAQRLLCARSGVDSHRLRRNMLSQDDFEKLAMTAGALNETPMYIDDTPGLTPLILRAKARRLAARHEIKAVFIDYLQLMTHPGVESRQQEVSTISREVKALARELNVPVVCLSQLNRSPESREGHKPRMSDLRESGSIEQDADVIMMLHREDYYHHGDEEYEENHTAEVIIVKQRNGPTGSVKLQFHEASTRFHDLARGGGPISPF